MDKANKDLRLACKGAGIPLYVIAETLGISDQTLFRNWRKELAQEEKEKIISIINSIKEGV